MQLFGSAYGVPFGLEAADADLFYEALTHLPPGWTRSPPNAAARFYILGTDELVTDGTPAYTLRVDGARIAERARLETLLHEFESDLQLHVAEMTPDLVFIHAGVVVWNGKAILLPGRSFSGKTRLVAELVKQGAGYFSDEYAVIDANGRVQAYPRRLSVRTPGEMGVARERISLLPAGSGAAFSAGAVFLCQFRSGGVWAPERLGPGEGALALVSHAVSARRSPARVLAAVGALVSAAAVYRTDRGEAVVAAEAILDSCGRIRPHIGGRANEAE